MSSEEDQDYCSRHQSTIGRMDNLTDNSTPLCSISKTVSEKVELTVVLVLECVCGILALFPSITTLTLLWRVKIFHGNLRLILANLTCNLLFFAASATFKAAQRLLTTDPCDLPMLLKTCMEHDFLVVIPLHNALISLVILNLERLYATVRYRNYDYASSIPYLGIFLLAAAWATTLGLNLPGYFAASPDLMVPVCEIGLVADKAASSRIITTMVCLEIVAAAITFFVYVYNKYILGRISLNRARYNLSARFQVHQNVQLNTALMPGMVLHMVCYLPTYIFLCVLIMLRGPLPMETRAWLLHLTYLWRLLYALMDPVLLITLNANLRHSLKKTLVCEFLMMAFRCGGKRNKSRTQDTVTKSIHIMNAHFDFLQQSWNTPRQVTLIDK